MAAARSYHRQNTANRTKVQDGSQDQTKTHELQVQKAKAGSVSARKCEAELDTMQRAIDDWRSGYHGVGNWRNLRWTAMGDCEGVSVQDMEDHLARGMRLRDRLQSETFSEHVPESHSEVFESWFRASQMLVLLSEGISLLSVDYADVA